MQARVKESDGLITEEILMTLEKIAGEGSHQAQVHLAHFYTGEMEIIGDFDVSLEADQLDLAKGKYWALKASAGSEFEAVFATGEKYEIPGLVRVLMRVNDDECKLRALNLLVRATSAGDYDAMGLLEEHFTGFNLETFLSSYKESPLYNPAQADARQKNLF